MERLSETTPDLHPAEKAGFREAAGRVQTEVADIGQGRVIPYLWHLDRHYAGDHRLVTSTSYKHILYRESQFAASRHHFFADGLYFGLRFADLSSMNDEVLATIGDFGPQITPGSTSQAKKNSITTYSRDGLANFNGLAAGIVIDGNADLYQAELGVWYAREDFLRGVGLVLHQAIQAGLAARGRL
jgi:hypothetical protein